MCQKPEDCKPDQPHPPRSLPQKLCHAAGGLPHKAFGAVAGLLELMSGKPAKSATCASGHDHACCCGGKAKAAASPPSSHVS